MTVQETKKMLIAVWETEARYRLAHDKAEHFGEHIYQSYAEVRRKDMIRARQRAERLIATLDHQHEKEVITRRYLIHQTWEEIADVMHYSGRQVFRVHDRALKKMSLNVTQRE